MTYLKLQECIENNDVVGFLLLARTIDINALRMEDMTFGAVTPLMYAVRKTKVSIVEALLDMGADPDIKEDEGWTALHFARNVLIVKALIDAGADINLEAGGLSWTPLHFTVEDKNVDTTDLLVQAGANINVQNKYGRTPLHISCEKGHLEAVQYLVQSGCNTAIRDGRGCNAMYYALRSKNPEIVKTLLAAGMVIDDTAKKPKLGTWAEHLYSTNENSSVHEKTV